MQQEEVAWTSKVPISSQNSLNSSVGENLGNDRVLIDKFKRFDWCRSNSKLPSRFLNLSGTIVATFLPL